MVLNKVIIAPDSFKGALSAERVANIIGSEVTGRFPGCEIVFLPIADGGEGSLNTIILAAGGRLFSRPVRSPDGRTITANYGVTDSGTAVIELAESSGITKQNGLHPLSSSTYGFGQTILAALERGAREFILCLGGSATTDGGCGMAAALGARFYDAGGRMFTPSGGTLGKIERIDLDSADKRVTESSFTAMCDVENPLYGKNGAAYVYGPQKGAGPKRLKLLDDGLRNLAEKLEALGFPDYGTVEGAGAAGGLGAGCCAFLGASLRQGSRAILELCGFSQKLVGCDLIITGEGRLDSQSFSGKALSGILGLHGSVPVWAICGDVQTPREECARHGVTAFSASEPDGKTKSLAEPERYLALAARRALNTL